MCYDLDYDVPRAPDLVTLPPILLKQISGKRQFEPETRLSASTMTKIIMTFRDLECSSRHVRDSARLSRHISVFHIVTPHTSLELVGFHHLRSESPFWARGSATQGHEDGTCHTMSALYSSKHDPASDREAPSALSK